MERAGVRGHGERDARGDVYLKKPPMSVSKLEHYAGRDKIITWYRSHRAKQVESLTLSGDEFMERFSWHVPEKRFRMVRYYGFLSPSKRALLDVVYALTETERKTARKVTCTSGY